MEIKLGTKSRAEGGHCFFTQGGEEEQEGAIKTVRKERIKIAPRHQGNNLKIYKTKQQQSYKKVEI